MSNISDRELLELIATQVGKLTSEFSDFKNETSENFKSVNVRLDNIEDRTDRTEGQLNTIQSQVDRIETRVDTIQSQVDRIENRVDKIDSKVNKIESRVDKIDKRIIVIENEHGAKLDAILDGYKQLAEGQEIMKSQLDKLATTQMMHDIDIMVLKGNVK